MTCREVSPRYGEVPGGIAPGKEFAISFLMFDGPASQSDSAFATPMTTRKMGRVSLSVLAALLLLAGQPAYALDEQAAPPPSAVETQPAPALPAEVPASPPAATPTPAADQAAASPPDSGKDESLLVTGRRPEPKIDPFEAVNVESYKAVQVIDKAVVAPAAEGYKKVVPSPIRAGVRNFFNNLQEPVSFLNHLLQFKPGRAVRTLGRFGINTTIGIGGLFDFATKKPFRIQRWSNGFANTMGFYGIGAGPFLFLPLVGPTTVRDLIGVTIDKTVIPAISGTPFGKPYIGIPASMVTSLDYRVQYDAQLRAQRESADPYAAARSNYLETRKAEIAALHGNAVRPPPPPPPPVKLPDQIPLLEIPPAPDATAQPAVDPALAPLPAAPATAVPAPADSPAL